MLSDKLKQLRSTTTLTQSEFAKKIDVARTTYAMYEQGNREPDYETLLRIANYYSVTTDYLLGGPNVLNKSIITWYAKYMDRREYLTKKNKDHQLSKGEREELHKLNSLAHDDGDFDIAKMNELNNLRNFNELQSNSNSGQSEVIREANKGVLSGLNPVNDYFRIPILGHIAAGEPIFATEHIEDYIDIPNPGDYDPDELFMLKVKGDSMIGSRIHDGDTVLVKIQPEVENGEIAVVNVNGDEATLKKVKRLENGQFLLMPSNDAYEPILVNHEGARIVGKVIQVIFEP